MQDCMMEGMGGMMWGMGFLAILLLILVVLLIGAVIKYLFFDSRRGGRE